jgi:cytochrome c2
MTLRVIWITTLLAALAVGSVSAPAQQAAQPSSAAAEDPGRALFAKKCGQCHSLAKDKNGNGPSLHRIIDRQAAAVPGFKYSRAMRQMAAEDTLEWNEENLTLFLEKPSLLVPGTRMAFPGIKKKEDLNALIEWIRANSGPPSDEQ